MRTEAVGLHGLAKPFGARALLRSVPKGWLLAGAPLALLVVFFVLPVVLHLSGSFRDAQGNWTLEHYREFFSQSLYVQILIRTFVIGTVVGLAVVILGFPLGYFLVRTTSKYKSVLITITFMPLLASVIMKTFGWYAILANEGMLNRLLLMLGIVDAPVSFVPSPFAITMGLIHMLLPYGALTIMSSLQGVPQNLELAAENLGANRFKIFTRVLLPLTFPGIVGGFSLAFAITLSAYAVVTILGGPRSETMATMIYLFALGILDMKMAAVMSTILLSSALAALGLAFLVDRRWSKKNV